LAQLPAAAEDLRAGIVTDQLAALDLLKDGAGAVDVVFPRAGGLHWEHFRLSF
jgi:hypothetical protein